MRTEEDKKTLVARLFQSSALMSTLPTHTQYRGCFVVDDTEAERISDELAEAAETIKLLQGIAKPETTETSVLVQNPANPVMSKRMTLAAMTMQGDWATQSPETGFFLRAIPDDDLLVSARHYFRMADAMIAAEAEGETQNSRVPENTILSQL